MTRPLPESSVSAESNRLRPAVCVCVFAILVVWLLWWPYTGDGDAAMHYRNFRESAVDPVALLGPWARPVYAATMMWPAMFGHTAVRIFTAVITTLVVWHTMRLADDLGLANATLAGPLVLCQPFAFALASDTLTEMPMALGIVVAIRLWWARRTMLSCLLVSFLPMVRPEGFFLIPLWAVMLLGRRASPGEPPIRWPARITSGATLATGITCWVLACAALANDPLYFLHVWSWPPGGVAAYGSGSLFRYVVNWPTYCGPVLLPLFILGLLPALTRPMALPWTIWGAVFVVHSVLWWRGWFASVGVLRIMACTSPITAVICLHGWNLIASSRFWRQQPRKRRFALAATVMTVAVATPAIDYVADYRNHRPRLIRAAVNFVNRHDLLADAPDFFVSDELALAMLDYPARSDRFRPNLWGRQKQLDMLAGLSPGAVGIWDNNRGLQWFGVTIDELASLGFEVVFQADQTVDAVSSLRIWSRRRAEYQRCVVVRKTTSSK